VFFAKHDGKRVGEYTGWSDDKAREFLNHLIKVIGDNWIYPIGFGIVVKDFNDLPLERKQWLTGGKFRADKYISFGCPNKPYYLPFQFCVLGASQISGASARDKINFFAGLDRTFSGYATELHKSLLGDERIDQDLRVRLGQISYPFAKDTPGIQAADLVANRMYQHAQKLLENRYLEAPILLRKILKRAKKNQRFTLFDRQALDDMEVRAAAMYERIMRSR